MNYAVKYKRHFKYNDLVNEFILPWSTKGDIVDFVTNTFPQDKKIIIDFQDEYNSEIESAIPILAKLKREHESLSARINIIQCDKIIPILKEHEIKVQFSRYCNSWDELFGQIQLGANDVTIASELGFDLKNVKKYCSTFGVNVRAFPNVAQYGGFGIKKEIPDIMKFFIRPEDVDVYENYIDTFEFWDVPNRNSTIFEIYYSRQWLGNLNEIITEFEDDVPNTGLTKYFAIGRVQCKKRCMMGKCNNCIIMKNTAKTMVDSEFEIETERVDIRNERRINKETLSDGGGASDEYDNETSTDEEL